MPAVDVDRETAHAAAARELAKSVYPKPSVSDRIVAWLRDLLDKLLQAAAALPGGWLTVVVLGLLVAALALAAVSVARRTMGGRGVERLYGGRTLSAADHRTRAQQSAAQGDWGAAIRQRVRAIGRQLEQDGVLNSMPGRTAGEMARDAGAAWPAIAGELVSAATVFNDVTYGGQPGTASEYRLVSELDERLCRQRVKS